MGVCLVSGSAKFEGLPRMNFQIIKPIITRIGMAKEANMFFALLSCFCVDGLLIFFNVNFILLFTKKGFLFELRNILIKK
jgi:hypothetical protein